MTLRRIRKNFKLGLPSPPVGKGRRVRVSPACRHAFALLGVVMIALAAAAETKPAPADASSSGRAVRTRAPLIAAAGDIACDDGPSRTGRQCRQYAVSQLFRGRGLRAILALGDNQYERGSLSAYRRYFGASWGRFFRVIRPAPGNHEYLTSHASGYFHYFGWRAGSPDRGYYSFNLGSWHLISLNSNCSEVGGCRVGSPQERWLRRDLAHNRRRCILAYWHHPRFSSGEHGNHDEVAPFWRALYRARADVVLNGHDHDYERFRPQTPDGRLSARGIREFVVGTGGANHYPFASLKRNSVKRGWATYGALFLRLRPRSYRFYFVRALGAPLRDSGTIACH